MNQLLHGLGELGFSPYEARAYAALVKHAPANGYEVAKAAGIPTSKIYETLQRLQQRGAVRLFASDPVRYMATPPSDLLATLRGRYEQSLDKVERASEELPKPRLWRRVLRLPVIAAFAAWPTDDEPPYA